MTLNYQEEFDKLEKMKNRLTDSFEHHAAHYFHTNETASLASGIAEIIRTQAYLSQILESRSTGSKPPAP
jgi:hypothetical protein